MLRALNVTLNKEENHDKKPKLAQIFSARYLELVPENTK